jgi:hypothetical protein
LKYKLIPYCIDDNTSKAICKGNHLACLEMRIESVIRKESVVRLSYMIVTKQDETWCRKITVRKEKDNILVRHALITDYKDIEVNIEDIFKIFQVDKLVSREIITWN